MDFFLFLWYNRKRRGLSSANKKEARREGQPLAFHAWTSRMRSSRPLFCAVIALGLTFLYDMFFLFLAEPLSEIFPILGDYL